MKRLKIKDIVSLSDIMGDNIESIFYNLTKTSGGNPLYPLVNDFITNDNYHTLDVDYFIGFSNEKYLSPLANKLYHEHSEDFDGLCNELVNIIYTRFGSKWKHIWDALNTAYNPLENYSMLEERTPDITKERTLDTTDERTPDLTKTTNGTGTTSTDSQTGIFGFNSPQSNPSGTIDGNQTDTITDRTETETGTDTSTQSGTITDTESGKETLERSGNIGVTTSQQMLQSEFEVRKYDFYKEIYKDIDSILCLKIY